MTKVYIKNPDLRNFTSQEVQNFILKLGGKPFHSRQILQWLYQKAVTNFDYMTNLPKKLRQNLITNSRLTQLTPKTIKESNDGTKKLLFVLEDGLQIESVLIPEKKHHTLCVSSQVGCAQGCKFCKTATLGFQRNLKPAEIIGQIFAARKLVNQTKPLTNLAFMGMGEPLDNLNNLTISLGHILDSHGLRMNKKKIIISTVGISSKIPIFAQAVPIPLAISLNASSDILRNSLMPVNRRFPLSTLKNALLNYPLKPNRKITIEYLLLKGINDRPKHAYELIRWIHGLKCKINLIPFNSYDGTIFESSTKKDILTFQKILLSSKILAFIRQSHGGDISAACGQLHTYSINSTNKNNQLITLTNKYLY